MKILIHGACGKMGDLIKNECIQKGYQIHLFDVSGDGINVLNSYDHIENVDVVIDFSHHFATKNLIHYCLHHQLPIVIGTTGHTKDEEDIIQSASYKIPIFKASNFSYGVYVINELIKIASSLLDDSYDIEIIEKHHKFKVDSPSGTAITLAESIMNSKKKQMILTHHQDQTPRKKDEIGMLSLRGGHITGEHTVVFAGEDDIIEIKHEALSRVMFAKGALRAACFIIKKHAGLYNMDSLNRKENIDE